MNKPTQVQHIIFDFDGVLAETNEIRIEGFRTLFSSYSLNEQNSIVSFASANGGLSRYVKIRHFFEVILSQPISEEQVNQLSAAYSAVVKDKIVAEDAVKGSLEFLEKCLNHFDFAIISGSDELELRYVCVARGIAHFFKQILGSPSTKQENFLRLFDATGWKRQHCLFVGDTRNDQIAANDVGVLFLARQSGLETWQHDEVNVIDDLTQLESKLFAQRSPV